MNIVIKRFQHLYPSVCPFTTLCSIYKIFIFPESVTMDIKLFNYYAFRYIAYCLLIYFSFS